MIIAHLDHHYPFWFTTVWGLSAPIPTKGVLLSATADGFAALQFYRWPREVGCWMRREVRISSSRYSKCTKQFDKVLDVHLVLQLKGKLYMQSESINESMTE